MSSDTSWSPVYVGMDRLAKRVWSLASAKPSASDVIPFRTLAFVPECPTGTQRPAVEDSTHPRDRRCSKSHPPQDIAPVHAPGHPHHGDEDEPPVHNERVHEFEAWNEGRFGEEVVHEARWKRWRQDALDDPGRSEP